MVRRESCDDTEVRDKDEIGCDGMLCYGIEQEGGYSGGSGIEVVEESCRRKGCETFFLLLSVALGLAEARNRRAVLLDRLFTLWALLGWLGRVSWERRPFCSELCR